jgi:hypothetical protein
MQKITDEMIAKARQLWPDAISFDFVECCNPVCTFVGLVQSGEDICPDCRLDSLEWADENQKNSAFKTRLNQYKEPTIC